MLLNLKPAEFEEVEKTLERIGVRYLFDATTSMSSDKKEYLKETIIDSINKYMVLSEDSDANDIRTFMTLGNMEVSDLSDEYLMEYSKDVLHMLTAKVIYRAVCHRYEQVSRYEEIELLEQLKLLPKIVQGK